MSVAKNTSLLSSTSSSFGQYNNTTNDVFKKPATTNNNSNKKKMSKGWNKLVKSLSPNKKKASPPKVVGSPKRIAYAVVEEFPSHGHSFEKQVAIVKSDDKTLSPDSNKGKSEEHADILLRHENARDRILARRESRLHSKESIKKSASTLLSPNSDRLSRHVSATVYAVYEDEDCEASALSRSRARSASETVWNMDVGIDGTDEWSKQQRYMEVQRRLQQQQAEKEEKQKTEMLRKWQEQHKYTLDQGLPKEQEDRDEDLRRWDTIHYPHRAESLTPYRSRSESKASNSPLSSRCQSPVHVQDKSSVTPPIFERSTRPRSRTASSINLNEINSHYYARKGGTSRSVSRHRSHSLKSKNGDEQSVIGMPAFAENGTNGKDGNLLHVSNRDHSYLHNRDHSYGYEYDKICHRHRSRSQKSKCTSKKDIYRRNPMKSLESDGPRRRTESISLSRTRSHSRAEISQMRVRSQTEGSIGDFYISNLDENNKLGLANVSSNKFVGGPQYFNQNGAKRHSRGHSVHITPHKQVQVPSHGRACSHDSRDSGTKLGRHPIHLQTSNRSRSESKASNSPLSSRGQSPCSHHTNAKSTYSTVSADVKENDLHSERTRYETIDQTSDMNQPKSDEIVEQNQKQALSLMLLRKQSALRTMVSSVGLTHDLKNNHPSGSLDEFGPANNVEKDQLISSVSSSDDDNMRIFEYSQEKILSDPTVGNCVQSQKRSSHFGFSTMREEELLDQIQKQRAELRSHALVVKSLEVTTSMHRDQAELITALHKKLQTENEQLLARVQEAELINHEQTQKNQILKGEVDRWKSAHDTLTRAFSKANEIIDELRRSDLESNSSNSSPSMRTRWSAIHSAPLLFPDVRAANIEIQRLTKLNVQLLKKCKALDQKPLKDRLAEAHREIHRLEKWRAESTAMSPHISPRHRAKGNAGMSSSSPKRNSSHVHGHSTQSTGGHKTPTKANSYTQMYLDQLHPALRSKSQNAKSTNTGKRPQWER